MSMHKPSIPTDRLLLRRWRESDVEPFAALCADPEVMRFIGAGGTRTRAQAAEAIGICQTGNLASERIMRKLGMGFDRESVDPGCGRAVRVYRLAARS